MKYNFNLILVFLLVAAFLPTVVNAQSPSFKTYMNPVIPGDHPDCTVSKIGDYFYSTGSSFNVTPTIYRSTDLVHWEAIAQPVSASWTTFGDKPGGGCWGGQVVFYNNKYWDFFSAAGSMHFVTTTKPEGIWSAPVKVNNPSQLTYSLGYDNSVFLDDDGKWYLVVKNGQANNAIVELNTNGQPTGVVYDLNWLNPSPSFPFSWAEGPVMWKYKEYYYYSFARDLSGGQKVMRSKTLTADQNAWEMLGDLFNINDPLKSGSLFTEPNHSSNAILISDSTSWVIHPLYAKAEWKGQGRQGLLNQVRYNPNGTPVADYPVNKSFTSPNLPGSGIPWMVPKSDFFSSTTLNPEWSFLGYTPNYKWSLLEKPGWFQLLPKIGKINTITKNDGEHNYSLITRLEFDALAVSDEAGLIILRGDEKMSVKLSSSANTEGQKVIRFSFDNTVYETPNLAGKIVWLKMVRVNHRIYGYFSVDGKIWETIGKEFEISAIDSYSDFSSFTGTRQGLFVQNKVAAFDLYIYRDAYTSILAECPANQSGTTKATVSYSNYALDNIHNNDWALYAGVEFGNAEYQHSLDGVEFVAACNTSGGIIEVWADSIDTGTKISECAISSTGGIQIYDTFAINNILPITGRHDVYLSFKSTVPSSMFRLQSFKFITKEKVVTTDIEPGTKMLNLFPNPAKDIFSIQLGSPFEKVTILNLNGKSIYKEKISPAQELWTMNQSLPKGFYIVKLESNRESSSARLMIE